MSSHWPPQLRAFVENVLSQVNDSNRAKVNVELKEIIQKAYLENRLWETNWSTQVVPSLAASNNKPSTSYSNIVNNANNNNKKQKVNNQNQFSNNSQSISNNINKVKSFNNGNNQFVNHNLNSNASTNFTTSSLGFEGDESSMRAKRAKRFEQEYANHKQVNNSAFMSINTKRGKTFTRKNNLITLPDEPDPNVIDWDKYTIVGLSQQLEKPYLRLTSAPDPKTIRPLNVLKKSLEHLKTHWRMNRDYNFICDQFKSLRQDLTVQRIKNDFTVSVYEIHARLALENGDLGEYNQCAANLKTLYGLNLNGNIVEFLAYQILYLCYSRNWSAVNILAGVIKPEHKNCFEINHALKVRSALATSNYNLFFKLHKSTPNMGSYIIDAFVDRERLKALIIICKAYVKIPLTFIVSELNLGSFGAAKDFINSFGVSGCYERSAIGVTSNGVPPDENKVILCKQVLPNLINQVSKFVKVDIKGQLP